MFFFSVSM